MIKKIMCALLLSVLSSAALYADPYCFPVPFVRSRGNQITFTSLPAEGTIKILTINGELVREIIFNQSPPSIAWDVTNSAGKPLATGVYFFQVEGTGHRTHGKLVVIQ